jgi:hypothetical protein
MKMSKLYSVAFASLCLLFAPAWAQDSSGVEIAPPEPVAGTPSINTQEPLPVTPDANAPVATAAASPEVDPVSELIPAPVTPIEKGISDQLRLLSPQINVNMMPSLFFSTWEHDLIIDARRGITSGTAIVDENVIEDSAIITSGPRDISLSGILYVSSKDWTIWLNGIRVTPRAIPESIMDIKVFKDYVELDWFDPSTNQIFPIRLRTHQRFNLDTRIFLPG